MYIPFYSFFSHFDAERKPIVPLLFLLSRFDGERKPIESFLFLFFSQFDGELTVSLLFLLSQAQFDCIASILAVASANRLYRFYFCFRNSTASANRLYRSASVAHFSACSRRASESAG